MSALLCFPDDRNLSIAIVLHVGHKPLRCESEYLVLTNVGKCHGFVKQNYAAIARISIFSRVMTSVRRYLAPFLLVLQLLVVSGGPVLAQYCCGQRVELEAACEAAACCPIVDPCCEDQEAEEQVPCCEDGAELEVEFTYVGSAERAVFPSVLHELIPAETTCLQDIATMKSNAACVLPNSDVEVAEYAPPDAPSLGVWRL